MLERLGGFAQYPNIWWELDIIGKVYYNEDLESWVSDVPGTGRLVQQDGTNSKAPDWVRPWIWYGLDDTDYSHPIETFNTIAVQCGRNKVFIPSSLYENNILQVLK